MHARVHTHTHTHIHTYIHTHTHTHTHTYIHTHSLHTSIVIQKLSFKMIKKLVMHMKLFCVSKLVALYQKNFYVH